MLYTIQIHTFEALGAYALGVQGVDAILLCVPALIYRINGYFRK